MLTSWCKETTTTTGTNNLTVAQITGYPRLSEGAAVNRRFPYTIVRNSDGKPLEEGWGYLSATSTFVRERVLQTYVGGSLNQAPSGPVNLGTDDTDGTWRVVMTPNGFDIAMPPPFISTRYGLTGIYSSHDFAGTPGTLVLTDDRQYLVPFKLEFGGIAKGIQVGVTTAAANSLLQCGLYDLNGVGEAGLLLARTADIDSSTTGYKQGAFTTNVAVSPGWYAVSVASKDNVAALAATIRSRVSGTGIVSPWGIYSTSYESYCALYKTNAAWTNLADVNMADGWSQLGAGNQVPMLALLFE